MHPSRDTKGLITQASGHGPVEHNELGMALPHISLIYTSVIELGMAVPHISLFVYKRSRFGHGQAKYLSFLVHD